GDVESGFGAHRLDDLADAAAGGVVGDEQFDGHGGGHACFAQQLAGPLRAVRWARLGLRGGVRADGRDGSAGGLVEAVEGDLVQDVAVDGRGEGLSDAFVAGQGAAGRAAGAGVAHVDVDAHVLHGGLVEQDQSLFAGDHGHVGGADLGGDVEFARSEVGQSDVVVGDRPVDDPVQSDLVPVVVVGAAVQDDAVLGDAFGEGERSHAHRVVGEV